MNELDKISEKILKQVIKHDCSLTSQGFRDLGLLSKYSAKELTECLNNLESLKFIYLTKDTNLLCTTFKARQYFLLKRKQFCKNIILSFIIPLVIAVIASYLTAKFAVNNEIVILVNSINNI